MAVSMEEDDVLIVTEQTLKDSTASAAPVYDSISLVNPQRITTTLGGSNMLEQKAPLVSA